MNRQIAWLACPTILRNTRNQLIISRNFYVDTDCKKNRKWKAAQNKTQILDAWNKVMRIGKTKKQTRYTSPLVGRPSLSLENVVSSLNNSTAPMSRRVIVLNKLFMTHITDFLSTGELCKELLDYNVQITKVAMARDFNVVNTFWLPNGDDSDFAIEELLNKVAVKLRPELMKLKVIGLVPKIQFVKDKSRATITEIDRRLRMADYPPGYIPSIHVRDRLKSDFTLETSLSPELKKKIMELEENEEFDAAEQLAIPPMSTNVFGLDHAAIMKYVTSGKRIADNEGPNSIFVNYEMYKTVKPQLSHHSPTLQLDKRAFVDYIRAKRFDMKKMMKVRERSQRDEINNFPLTDEHVMSEDEMMRELMEFMSKEFQMEDKYCDELDASTDKMKEPDNKEAICA